MFEEPVTEKTLEEKRSRAILWMIAATALVFIAILVLLLRAKPQGDPILENVVRAGAAEFDAYKSSLEIEVVDKIVHPNMIGMAQYEIKTRLTNRGGRDLTGIELIGRMIGLDDQVIKEAISLPIPRARTAPLKPGESMNVSVKIDAPAKVTEDMIKDLAVEVRGLRFQ
jgi:hypothetical protein